MRVHPHGAVAVRRELGDRVEAGPQRVDLLGGLAGNEIRVGRARGRGAFPPHRDGRGEVGDEAGLVDEQQRSVADADVSRIAEQSQELVEQPGAVVEPVALLHQDVALATVPATRPVLVRPAHAEREIGRPARDHLLERTLEQALAVEPVEVVAEPVHAVCLRECGLRVRDARVGEVVVAERARRPGLLVAGEQRLRPAHVRPLGEAFAPPEVVLRDPVELRQVERDRADRPVAVVAAGRHAPPGT